MATQQDKIEVVYELMQALAHEVVVLQDRVDELEKMHDFPVDGSPVKQTHV